MNSALPHFRRVCLMGKTDKPQLISVPHSSSEFCEAHSPQNASALTALGGGSSADVPIGQPPPEAGRASGP